MDVGRTLLALAAAAALASCSKAENTPPDEGAAASGPTAEEARAVAEGGLGAEAPGAGGEAAEAPGEGDAPAGSAPVIDRETYQVKVEAPDAASVGERAEVAVHVVPKEGWKMNHDFPMRLEVTAPEGVDVEGAEQTIPDAVHYSDERGEWAVHFTPETPGEAAFEAGFRFAVCTDDVCVPKREKLAWSVSVE